MASPVSSIVHASSELGAALSIAILGTIGSMIYRVTLTTSPGLPVDVTRRASESLATADEAARFPGVDGERLLDVARDAFVLAQGGVLLTAAAVLLVLALIVAFRLRAAAARIAP